MSQRDTYVAACWNCGKDTDGKYRSRGLPFCDRNCFDEYVNWLHPARRAD